MNFSFEKLILSTCISLMLEREFFFLQNRDESYKIDLMTKVKS